MSNIPSYNDLTLAQQVALGNATTIEAAAAALGVDLSAASGMNAAVNRGQLNHLMHLAQNDLERNLETQRQQNIESAVGRIHEAFGRYDEPYYNKLKSDYQNYYDPQVGSQYEQARRKLTFALARGPGAASSAGAKAIGGLQSQLEGARSTIRERARQHAQQTRQNVAGLENTLVQQAYGGEGLDQIGQTAAIQAGGNLAPGYSPISDLFSLGINASSGVV